METIQNNFNNALDSALNTFLAGMAEDVEREGSIITFKAEGFLFDIRQIPFKGFQIRFSGLTRDINKQYNDEIIKQLLEYEK